MRTFAAIKKRLAKATKGKWSYEYLDQEGYDNHAIIAEDKERNRTLVAKLRCNPEGDASFIANSKKDMRALIDEVEHMTAYLEAYDEMDSYKEWLRRGGE